MKSHKLSFFVVVALKLWILDSVAAEFAPVIETTKGPVRGTILETVKLSQQYFSYRNIRYAKPPVNYLRFKPPVEVDPWTEVLDAIEDGPVCPQIFKGIMMGQEDCLNLNVYTPKLPEKNDTDLRPVMFWIYGGAFKTGFNSKILYSPDYLIEEGVVFVSINYRLGPLGFLALGHQNATGNAGLKDQSLALRWVRDNIAKFGGDPNKVTIFGQSAGAASVDFHMLSPKSKGLFHGAISMSGASITDWALDAPSIARQKAFQLVRHLGFEAKNIESLLYIYYNVDVKTLIKAATKLTTLDLPFKPTIENVKLGSEEDLFLTECPIKIYKSENYNQVPHMLGYLKDETLIFLKAFINLFNTMDDAIGYLEKFDLDGDCILDSIKKNSGIITNITIFTDLFFAAPIDYKQKLLSKSKYPVYFYRYIYDYDKSLHKIIEGVPVNGSAHSDDLPMIFYSDFFQIDPKMNDIRELVQRRMTRLWTNFAKFGNPTPKGINDKLLNISWPDSRSNGKILEISDKLEAKDRYITTQMKIIETAIEIRGWIKKGCLDGFPRILHRI